MTAYAVAYLWAFCFQTLYLLLDSLGGGSAPAFEVGTFPWSYGLVTLGILGVGLGLVAVVLAWRGNRGAVRVAAGALVVNLLTALPAFFVDVPVWIKLAVGLSVLATVAAIVLMFSGARRPVAVMD